MTTKSRTIGCPCRGRNVYRIVTLMQSSTIRTKNKKISVIIFAWVAVGKSVLYETTTIRTLIGVISKKKKKKNQRIPTLYKLSFFAINLIRKYLIGIQLATISYGPLNGPRTAHYNRSNHDNNIFNVYMCLCIVDRYKQYKSNTCSRKMWPVQPVISTQTLILEHILK